MGTLKGIDVSKHNGVIDWAKVKASGKADFVLVRAGYGKYESQVDAKFSANMAGVTKYGIPYGLYWYSYAESVEAAKKEAAACLAVIKGYDPQLPVFYDMEYEPDILKMTNAQRTECCNAFCAAIKAAGYKNVGVYASKDFLENKLNAKKLADGTQIWVAQYVSSAKAGNPGSSSYTGTHQIWQYYDKGSVNGISGNVDLDYGYVDYTAQAAAKWVSTAQGWKYGSYRSRWLKQSGRWYYFDAQGIALTGWHNIDGVDYYFATKAFADASGGVLKECQAMQATVE